MKSLIQTLFHALLFSSVPLWASAEAFVLGDLTINDTIATETPVTANAGAGYLTITNAGTTDAKLIKIDAAFARVMIHDMVIENEIAKMTHMDSLTIPAGESVTFAPGGMHVMFMGLNGDPFEVGEEIPATLVFEKAGQIDVVFTVKARDHQH
jgi:copper(I)-binding protein